MSTSSLAAELASPTSAAANHGPRYWSADFEDVLAQLKVEEQARRRPFSSPTSGRSSAAGDAAAALLSGAKTTADRTDSRALLRAAMQVEFATSATVSWSGQQAARARREAGELTRLGGYTAPLGQLGRGVARAIGCARECTERLNKCRVLPDDRMMTR